MVIEYTTIGISTNMKKRFLDAKLKHASKIGKQISDNDYIEYLLKKKGD